MVVSKISQKVQHLSLSTWLKLSALFTARPNLTLFIFGCALLSHGLAGVSRADGTFDDTLIRAAVCDLFILIEGSFGALITTVAGIGAIVSASMGAYRAGMSLLFTGCGSFILRSLVSLYFEQSSCTGSSEAPAP